MIDYLNPHHIYPDTQNQPDMSKSVKTESKEAREMDIITDTLMKSPRSKHTELIAPGMEAARSELPQTDAEHIIRLYRQGMSHIDIIRHGYDLADVRRVISEGTAKDETLYQVHKGIESRWSKRSATGGEQ